VWGTVYVEYGLTEMIPAKFPNPTRNPVFADLLSSDTSLLLCLD